MCKATFSTFFLLVVVVASPVWPQSLVTDGNIETDGQVVSKVATGTAPLAVSSATLVSSLNADQVDGLEGTALALDADLQNVETMLMAFQSQVDALGLALVPRTGQTTCYDAAGVVTACGTGIGLAQDGELQLGVTWPNPRFIKNADATVTDNLTGLIWLEDANCFGEQSWTNALAKANALFDGCTDCGGTDNDCNLGDSSVPGQWRLPNVRELQSLAHYGVSDPAVPNTAGTGQWAEGDPFSGVQSSSYWSSTTFADDPGDAWVVSMGDAWVDFDFKANPGYVWPVRGGQ